MTVFSEAIAIGKTLYPLGVEALTIFGTEAHIDTWRRVNFENKVHKLTIDKANLTQELTNLKQQLSDNELCSPTSGFNLTLKEYVWGSIEEKTQLLQNALLNGFFGDYTIELREDLYKIVQQLQPLDVQILKYLVTICPDQEFFIEKDNEAEESKRPLQQRYQNKEITKEEYESLGRQAEADYNNIRTNLFMDSILKSFPGYPSTVVQRALDRLQNAGLVYNNGANHWGLYNPYHSFIPLKLAQIFLNFIADPRNCLQAINVASN